MNTIDGMKVIRAVKLDHDDLIIVGTEKQIVMHMIKNQYQYFEVCKWFNTYKQDVQSKVLVAIDQYESSNTVVHNIRADFNDSLKQLEIMYEMFDYTAIVRLIDVLYLPALEIDVSSITLEQVQEPQPTPDNDLSWITEQKEIIKDFRQANKINQTKFAQMCCKYTSIENCKQHHISMIERGESHFSVQEWKEVKKMIGSKTVESIVADAVYGSFEMC